MNRTIRIAAALCALGALAGAAHAQQPNSTIQEIEKYRAALGDGNPAELWEMRGEELWKAKRGPKKESLEKCDLGLGPGVVKGAYTMMPRYFADSGRVEDLESRLVTCMVNLQGFTPAEAKKDPFGGPGKKVPMDALVAYVTSQSRGMPMKVAANHPKEQEAYDVGKKIFYFRGGPHDFSCASCHGVDNQRIRLQDLPNLTKNPGDGVGFAAWPAYRVSNGQMWSMQLRLNDCYRQQRFPYPEFGSDALTALSTYLGVNAQGAKSVAPAIKR